MHPLLKTSRTLKLIQGPLAGYSNAAFRRQIWHWGQPLWTNSEMIPAKMVLQSKKVIQSTLYRHPDEGPLVYQLSGNNATILSEAAHCIHSDYQADGIDLNCGCPKKKIRKKGCGSALLAQPNHLYTLLSQLRLYTPFLTVKIRIDGKSSDHFTKDVLQAAQAAHVDAIIIHARHWQEDDQTPCNWDHTAKWVADTKCPIIINGNLTSLNNIQKWLDHTQAFAAMIARGSCGQPWLIGQLHAHAAQQKWQPTTNEYYQSLLSHLMDLATLYGGQSAYWQSQSLLRYYQRFIPSLQQIPWQQASSFDDLILHLTSMRMRLLAQ